MELRRGGILFSLFNLFNAHAPVPVVPLTSQVARVYPFGLFLPREATGLDRNRKAQVQLIRHVHRRRVCRPLGQLPEDLHEALDERIKLRLGLL